MAGMPLLVVAGIPELAQALRETQLFPDVLEPRSTGDLVASITSPQVAQCKTQDIVFVFADTLTQDDPNMPLPEILRRLTVSDYQVVIVPVTTRGAELQRQNPKAGLLPLPLTVNEALFAIGSFGYTVDPRADGFTPITMSGAIPVQQTPGPAAARPSTDAQLPSTAPDTAAGTPPAGGGWVVPDSTEATSGTEAARAGGTGQTQAPAPEPTVAWQAPSSATPTETAAPSYVAPTEHVPPAFAPAPPNETPMQTSPTPAFAPPTPSTLPPAFETEQSNYYGATTPPATRPSLTALTQPPGTGVLPNTPLNPAPLAPAGGPAHRQDSGYTAVPAAQQRRGYVITIAVSKGGVGKSSMTLNLAAFLGMRLRAQGKTVCVVDANYQQADSGKYLDTYTPNINTVVNNPALLTPERILEALVHKPEYNLSVLLGPATPDEASPLAISPRLYNEILDLLKQRFDYVFIDTPVAEKFHDMFSKFALPRADYIVVPVAPNFTTLHNADNWLRAAVVAPKTMYGAGIEPNRVGVVLNRAEDGIGCSEEDVRHTMASWHFLGSIPETKEWKACNNRNELVAPRNYAELSQAFAEVLHAATGEPVLLENLGQLGQEKKGMGGLFKGVFRRGK